MCADVLATLAQTHSPSRIVVFTSSDVVRDMALPLGFDVVREACVAGHTEAVNLMVSELSPTSSQILSISADLPMLAPTEIDFVFQQAIWPITIIPSCDGDGTNGIAFTPPARINVEYGPGSFARHLSKVMAAGFPSAVLNVPGIAFDIDTPADLKVFLNSPVKESATWRFLMSMQ